VLDYESVAPPAAKAEAKVPAPTKADLTKIAKAPARPPGALAPAARPEAPPRPGSFSLQVGAMINEANAQQLKQRLEQLGYSPVIQKGLANVRRHVVTIGDTPERAAAEDLAKLLANQGIRARVTSEGGRFTVEVGSFASEDDAIDLARELQKRNYPPMIRDLQQKATLYLIRLGNYASRDEARAKGAELESKGFRYFVVKN